jgi:hypothetical protein
LKINRQPQQIHDLCYPTPGKTFFFGNLANRRNRTIIQLLLPCGFLEISRKHRGCTTQGGEKAQKANEFFRINLIHPEPSFCSNQNVKIGFINERFYFKSKGFEQSTDFWFFREFIKRETDFLL